MRIEEGKQYIATDADKPRDGIALVAYTIAENIARVRCDSTASAIDQDGWERILRNLVEAEKSPELSRARGGA